LYRRQDDTKGDNIKIQAKEIGYLDIKLIQLDHDWSKCWEEDIAPMTSYRV